MAQNDRTPATGMARALENVCLAADIFRDTAQPELLQASRLTQRFKLSPAVAAVVAGHVYGTAEKILAFLTKEASIINVMV